MSLSPTLSVKLVKRHIHAGLPHAPGSLLTLDRPLAEWLIQEGAAELAQPAAASQDATPADAAVLAPTDSTTRPARVRPELRPELRP